MAAIWLDLFRLRMGRDPSIEQAFTRPDITLLRTPTGMLRVRDSGGQNPSVIFACDAPNVVEHYDRIFELLSSSYRLVCFEMPGFGFSRPKSDFDFSMPKYVDTVAYLISTLELGPATLVFPCAWSYIAFQLAIEQPTLVERLVVSQCPHWDEERAWTRRIDFHGLMATPVVGQLIMAVAPQKMSDTWYKNACRPGLPNDSFIEPARKALSNGAIFCLASLIQAWFTIKDVVTDLVPQPTVVMWGGSDRSHKRSNPHSAMTYLQHGKLLIYPEAGHFPELEDPQRLKDLLSNKDLWDDIASRPTSELQAEEKQELGESVVGETAVDDTSSKVLDVGRTEERRKPFDSHL